MVTFLAQLADPYAEETYTAADLGRLLSITRQGATRLVQREARIAHLQGSLAKLQETAPAPQELPTAE
ncbi:MAG: hypothetical protein IPL28_10675 [Chloroflexi bacterium]|nr:hypothetical protein [Chloroflexota bacterium]